MLQIPFVKWGNISPAKWELLRCQAEKAGIKILTFRINRPDMLSDRSVRFLRAKISDIKTAILYNLSEAIIKLPTSIVSTLKMDNEGQIWFLVNKPSYDVMIYDRQFPVRLDFYRKGYPFYLHVTGKASIITDPENIHYLIELDEANRKVAEQNFMLLKVAIQKAEYYEKLYRRGSSKQLFQMLKNWIYDLVHKPKNYMILPDIHAATA